MAAILVASGSDLGDEAVCMLALRRAGFGCSEIDAALDDVIDQARALRVGHGPGVRLEAAE